MPRAGASAPGFYTVRVLVRDFRRSWRFYRDTLGLTPAPGHGEPPYGEFQWEGRPRVALFDRGLMAGALGLPPSPGPRGFLGHSALVLEVPDVDAVARRLGRRRVHLLAGPTDRPAWQLRTVHLRDPDGYLIEFCAPMGPDRRSGKRGGSSRGR